MFPTNSDTDTELNQSQTRTDASAMSWFALQVRARREFGVSEHLRSNGFEGFLPTYRLSKRWSDRIKEAESPLFPGYLFCRFDPLNRLPILKIPGVMQIVVLIVNRYRSTKTRLGQFKLWWPRGFQTSAALI